MCDHMTKDQWNMSWSDICKFWVIYIKINLLAWALPPTPSCWLENSIAASLEWEMEATCGGGQSPVASLWLSDMELPTCPSLLLYFWTGRDTQPCSSKPLYLVFMRAVYLCRSPFPWVMELGSFPMDIVWLPFQLPFTRSVTHSLK